MGEVLDPFLSLASPPAQPRFIDSSAVVKGLLQYQGNTVRAGCVKGRNFRTRTPFWVFFGANCTR